MIPKTISEVLKEQDNAVLQEVKEYIDRLISDRDGADLPVVVLEENRLGPVTYRQERVYCGKSCKGCPHGPYWYAYWKEDGRTHTRYIGKELKEVMV
ncbi:MAG: hypothetical protein D4Q77_03965 [Methanothrix sp.]|nr:MAG: hypothetical protein D4Q77_03965 [Methanothrix sp.]